MLPNLSSTVLSFAQPITRRITTQTVVNHKPSIAKEDDTIQATITTPKPEDLQNIEVDTSLKYQVCHSVDEMKIDYRFIYKQVEYKVISINDRDDYGYYRSVGEEVQE